MPDSAPRGFDRFSPDFINLVGWVIILGAIASFLERGQAAWTTIAGLSLTYHGLWPDYLPWAAFGLLIAALYVIAALGLMNRRPWSINLLLVLTALWLVRGAGTSAMGTQELRTPTLALHTANGIGSLLSGAAESALALLLLRWLLRFRREFRPLPEPPAPSSVEI